MRIRYLADTIDDFGSPIVLLFRTNRVEESKDQVSESKPQKNERII